MSYKSFSYHFKHFLLSLIRQRRKIVSLQRSYQDTSIIKLNCDFLHSHLTHLTYDDVQLARFALRHEDKIRLLIPPHHKASIEKLSHYLNTAKTIATCP